MSPSQQRKIHQSENGDSWCFVGTERVSSFCMKRTSLLEETLQKVNSPTFWSTILARLSIKRS
jgi:hypothetical protein